MKKSQKKSIAILLMMVLAFSQFSIAFANESSENSIKEQNIQISEIVKTKEEESENQQVNEADIVPGKVLVKYRNGTSASVQSTAAYKVSAASIKTYEEVGISSLEISKDMDVLTAVEELEKNPNIEYAEPVYVVRSFETTVSDEVYADDEYLLNGWQWGLEAVNVDSLWQQVTDAERKKVTIAIVDTGVDLDHEDLADSIIDGYDFINDDDSADDDEGHGTHVAGIAAAITNNDKGIAGVAGGVQIMPVKVLDEKGSGTTETIVKGINYAVKYGADVINLSLGTPYRSMAVEDAVNNALANDVVVVAAVGNDYSGPVNYPAAFEGVIGVGAIDSYGNGFRRASYSNVGPEVDIVAPGTDILSTIPMNQDSGIGVEGYDLKTGTSMASPFVAGLVALIKADEPSLSYSQIQTKLQDNATDIDIWENETKDKHFGYGLINGDDDNEALPPYEFNRLVLYASREDYNDTTMLSVELETQNYKGTVNEEVYGSFNLMMQEYMINDDEDNTLEWIGEPKKLRVIDVVYGYGEEEFEFSQPDNCALYVEGYNNYFNSNRKYLDIGTIKGTITLPDNETAPEGGIDIQIDLNYEFEDIYIYDPYLLENQVTIPEGENSVEYSMHYPYTGSRLVKYTVQDIVNLDDQYVPKCYYNSNGAVPLESDAEIVFLGKEAINNVNITILKADDMNDDYDNNDSNAKEINIEDSIDGALDYASDIDYFTFEVDEDGMYKIYTEGSTDTYGELLDESLKPISGDDDSGEMYNFFISDELTKGIYHIEVSGYKYVTGEYRLVVDKQGDDYGDSIENAHTIALNQAVKGVINYDYDKDVFKFEVSEKGIYKIFAARDNYFSGIDIYAAVFYEDESISDDKYEKIVENYYDNRYLISEQELSEGTYYIEIQGYDEGEIGEYVLLIERQDIKIDDPNLEIAIYEAIEDLDLGLAFTTSLRSSDEDEVSEGGSSGGGGAVYPQYIFKEDVEKITKLIADGEEIVSLEGIEYLVNLEELSLANNEISELSPLSQLENLYHLNLDNNSISNITSLSSINQLVDLSLAQNQISDISRLSGFEDLSYLRLNNNNISNISSLSGMDSLSYLYLADNSITNYDAIEAYYTSLLGKDFLTAISVSISGTTKVDNTLTGNYEFNALDEEAQNHSTLRWLRSDSINGTYIAISGATGSSYKLTDSDNGKYIKFEVTPKTAEEEGIVVLSNAVGPIIKTSSGGGGGGGGGGGDLPSEEGKTIEKETGTVTLVEDEEGKKEAKVEVDDDKVKDMLKDNTKESAVIDVKTGEEADKVEVEMNTDVISAANENKKSLVVETDKVSFKIEPGTIEVDNSGDKISLSTTQLSYEEIKNELPKTEGEADAVSLVYDFNLSVGEKKVSNFNKPMTITIDIDMTKIKDKDKVGVYYFNETDNQWEYVGGKVEEGKITFTVEHFSTYTAMEYNKTFEDIRNHWAKEEIEKMASRHIAKGTTEDKFSPDESITRAEFAALIIRALEIKENSDSVEFKDIDEDAWYREVVSKAYEAGIVSGTEDNRFAPNDTITREQMATMIMRAYQYASGTKLGDIITTMEIRFNDEGTASSWARRNIVLANAKGIMGGFPDGSFRPKANATRAQAIVVIKKLLVELDVISE